MILDRSALDYYAASDVFLDVRDCLPPELAEQLREKLVERDGVYIAIDLADSGFESRFGLNNQPAYLVVPRNAPDPDRIERFLVYFFSD